MWNYKGSRYFFLGEFGGERRASTMYNCSSSPTDFPFVTSHESPGWSWAHEALNPKS